MSITMVATKQFQTTLVIIIDLFIKNLKKNH